jgi:putative ABC transport system substrate-binding protein
VRCGGGRRSGADRCVKATLARKSPLAIMRPALVAVVLVLGIGLPLSAPAQQPSAKIPRVGVLGDAPSFLEDAFRHGLRELGYVDGRNIVIESRPSEWKFERLPALAADLVRLQVDVIVSTNTRATDAARRATSTIPIVFTVSGDPVAEGLVASLGRPGGNLTGLATISPELVGKQLEMLKGVVPKLTRVAVLENPTQPSHARSVQHAESAARTLGLQLQVVEARTPSEIDAAFAAISSQRTGGLLVLRDAEFRTHRARIVALAARNRLPAVYGLREEAEAGGLIAYGASVPQLFRRAATYVDKILKGAKPADLPVEQPTKFELVINLKTAKALRLTIPPSLLAQADEVIQ